MLPTPTPGNVLTVDTGALAAAEPALTKTASAARAIAEHCAGRANTTPPDQGVATQTAARTYRSGLFEWTAAELTLLAHDLDVIVEKLAQTRERYERSENDTMVTVNDLFGATGGGPTDDRVEPPDTDWLGRPAPTPTPDPVAALVEGTTAQRNQVQWHAIDTLTTAPEVDSRVWSLVASSQLTPPEIYVKVEQWLAGPWDDLATTVADYQGVVRAVDDLRLGAEAVFDFVTTYWNSAAAVVARGSFDATLRRMDTLRDQVAQVLAFETATLQTVLDAEAPLMASIDSVRAGWDAFCATVAESSGEATSVPSPISTLITVATSAAVLDAALAFNREYLGLYEQLAAEQRNVIAVRTALDSYARGSLLACYPVQSFPPPVPRY